MNKKVILPQKMCGKIKKTKYIKKIKKIAMDKSGILKISGVTHALMLFLPFCVF